MTVESRPLREEHAFASAVGEVRYPRCNAKTEANLEVFDETLEECNEMLCLSNVAWDSFFEEILGENCGEVRDHLGMRRTCLVPGLDMNASSLSAASCSPSTSLAYSSWSLEASVFLILDRASYGS